MAETEYVDCEVSLSNYDQAALKVLGRTYEGRPTLDLTKLSVMLIGASLDAKQYGVVLFNALFPADDDLLAGYREGIAIARHQGKRLRFRLHIANTAPPDLHRLDWERLYDPKRGLPLGRTQEIVFSRFRSVGSATAPPPPVEGAPKLLIVIANPSNLAEHSLAAIERESIAETIKRAVNPLNAQVEVFQGDVTGARLHERLIEGKFDTLHIHAHAIVLPEDNSAHLVLEKEGGKADFIDEEFFAEIFDGTNLRLVNLVACHGGAQPRDDTFSGLGLTLLGRGYPAVVAMREAISIDAAILFTEHFYRGLVRTGVVDAAVNEARSHLWMDAKSKRLEGTEWSAPALFMRLEDGRVWNRSQPAAGVVVPQVPAVEEMRWQSLLHWIRRGQFIPVLGPDMNRGLLLSHAEVTELWAAQYGYGTVNYPTNNRNDLPRVSRYIEILSPGTRYPHLALLELLRADLLEREKLEDREALQWSSLSEVIARVAPRHFLQDKDDPHLTLAKLPISTYLTTNVDSFMTAALEHAGRTKVRREVCQWQDEYPRPGYSELQGSKESPLVFHLFGDDENPQSMVLTEDDHLDFLRLVTKDRWRIPDGLRETLTVSMLLFLGYNVRDLDFRILLKGVVEQLTQRNLERWAVIQIEPDESFQQQLLNFQSLQTYLASDCSNLKVIPLWLSVREFLVKLRAAFK